MTSLLLHRLPRAISLGLLCLGWASAAQAATLPPAGRLLASNCFQCHGTNGKGSGFERLAGKPAAELYQSLKEWQAGQEGEGIMAKHARGYSDEQLRALSQWLSRQR